jgi:hypothetical protein
MLSNLARSPLSFTPISGRQEILHFTSIEPSERLQGISEIFHIEFICLRFFVFFFF